MNHVEEEWIDVSLAMKSTNGFPAPTPTTRIEKNKSIMWAAGSRLLSFHSFPADDLFANMHFPCVTDSQNNLLNGMQKLTFAAFWLVTH